MDRSPGFGSAHTDSGPIKTWFPYGSTPLVLNLACMRNSPDRSTKSTRLNKKCSSTACKHRVSGSLSLPSRGPFHLSFTVLCAIGHQGVFSLTGWSPLLQSRFHVSRPTLDPAVPSLFSPTGLSPSLAGFPKTIPVRSKDHVRGPNPSMHARWFGLFPFRSPLLRKSSFLSPPPLLRCFSSPGSLPYVMDWRMDTWSLSRWVSPFRNLRINGYLLLPEAYRSLSRLSSALGAKASALCSFLLGLF